MIDIKSYFTKQISEFLESDEKSINIKYVNLPVIKCHLEEIGYETDYLETNGYNVDFWLHMKKENSNLKITGDLYYSESITISKQ